MVNLGLQWFNLAAVTLPLATDALKIEIQPESKNALDSLVVFANLCTQSGQLADELADLGVMGSSLISSLTDGEVANVWGMWCTVRGALITYLGRNEKDPESRMVIKAVAVSHTVADAVMAWIYLNTCMFFLVNLYPLGGLYLDPRLTNESSLLRYQE